MSRVRLAALALAASAAMVPVGASAAENEGLCTATSYRGARFVVCEIDLRAFRIDLRWRDSTGTPYGSLRTLEAALEREGVSPLLLMNAGMYSDTLAPIGLYVEGGEEFVAANTNEGPGNFHLLPNGVFYASGDTAGVMETHAYLEARPEADIATQSGPMLVIEGAIHPAFLPDGTSRKIRDGIGVRDDGHVVVVAIARNPVNFDSFARLFRDELGCDDALFLDGTISQLWSPQTGSIGNPFGTRLGPMLAVLPRE